MSCVFFAERFQDFCEISLGFLEIFKGFLGFFKKIFFNFQDFYDFNLIRFWDLLEIFKIFFEIFGKVYEIFSSDTPLGNNVEISSRIDENYIDIVSTFGF